MMLVELKRKLRQLKKLEAHIRLKEPEQYLWSDYFSTKDENDGSVKYNLKRLLKMSREELKEVFDEYFYHVYFQYYKENGIPAEGVYDTSLLSGWGLSPDASADEIKSKFRELAKKYHPDLGGSNSAFIQLVETYQKLMNDDCS
jgi:hypothetical protein